MTPRCASRHRLRAIQRKDEIQGVFVVNGNKAVFRPVETGISGVTDIEITKGLQKGDEIVVGSYKALRHAQARVERESG